MKHLLLLVIATISTSGCILGEEKEMIDYPLFGLEYDSTRSCYKPQTRTIIDTLSVEKSDSYGGVQTYLTNDERYFLYVAEYREKDIQKTRKYKKCENCDVPCK